MARDFLIVSPSYRRASHTKLDTYLDPGDMIFAIHKDDKDDYRRLTQVRDFIILPDETKKNMAKVRNYIRDYARGQGYRFLVMMDDDVKHIGYFEGGEARVLSPDSFLELLDNGFRMAEDVGTILWGMNLQADPKFYRARTPFSFLSPVLGPFTAHDLDDEVLRYDEDLPLKEDYDYFLQVIHKYHRVLRFNKYHYVADHILDTGGLAGTRSMSMENENLTRLIRKWGRRVIKTRDDSINPIMTVPIKGV